LFVGAHVAPESLLLKTPDVEKMPSVPAYRIDGETGSTARVRIGRENPTAPDQVAPASRERKMPAAVPAYTTRFVCAGEQASARISKLPRPPLDAVQVAPPSALRKTPPVAVPA
jgi:hypothetical protein